MHNLSVYLMKRWQRYFQIDDEEELEIYTYGLEIILYKVLFTLFIIVFCIFNPRYFIYSMLFVLCFFQIRKYAGGLHTDKMIHCLLIFIACYLLLVYLLSSFVQINLMVLVVMIVINFLILNKIAPIDCENKRLDEDEKSKNKKTTIISTLFWCMLSMIFYFLGYDQLVITTIYTVNLITILLLLAYFKDI